MTNRFLLFFAVLMSVSLNAFPAAMPVKELEFHLRQGSDEKELLEQVKRRRLLTPLDAVTEKRLLENGTSPAFIKEIKDPKLVLTEEEAIAEFQRIQDNRSRIAAAQQETSTPSGPLLKPDVPNYDAMKKLLSGKLVLLNGGEFEPYDVSQLHQVKHFIFFYTAGSDGPCQRFTPKLIEEYKRLKGFHPEFEIILVSKDNSEAAMSQYMKYFRIPFPALKFEDADTAKQWSSSTIPRLVCVNQFGEPETSNLKSNANKSVEHTLKEIAKLIEFPEQ